MRRIVEKGRIRGVSLVSGIAEYGLLCPAFGALAPCCVHLGLDRRVVRKTLPERRRAEHRKNRHENSVRNAR